ncbi:hypothetical protein NL676_008851 [Syzygium grande]|nr:hypothetical protein NL676_008851 [Syzygium grande]
MENEICRRSSQELEKPCAKGSSRWDLGNRGNGRVCYLLNEGWEGGQAGFFGRLLGLGFLGLLRLPSLGGGFSRASRLAGSGLARGRQRPVHRRGAAQLAIEARGGCEEDGEKIVKLKGGLFIMGY